jgi:hypothetical protein
VKSHLDADGKVLDAKLCKTAIILTGGIAIVSKVGAATLTNVGSLAPLTKSFTSAEKVGYWRRHYRRGYYGYGYLITAMAITDPTTAMATGPTVTMVAGAGAPA